MPRKKRPKRIGKLQHKRTVALSWPRFVDFTECEWIQSGTYRRMRFSDRARVRENAETFEIGTELDFIVWEPPIGQVRQKCDNCVRYHRATNVNCSATMRRRQSFLDTPGEQLFFFATQKPVPGRWRLVSATRAWRSPMEKETYMRIA